MPSFTATSHQGETLDALMWRILGDTTVIEQTLLLNRGIAGLGAILPENSPVTLPVILEKQAKTIDIVQLWD